MCAILKKAWQLYIVGKLNKCRFREKNMNCQFFFIPQKKIAKMTVRHSIKQMN